MSVNRRTFVAGGIAAVLPLHGGMTEETMSAMTTPREVLTDYTPRWFDGRPQPHCPVTLVGRSTVFTSRLITASGIGIAVNVGGFEPIAAGGLPLRDAPIISIIASGFISRRSRSAFS